MRVSLADDGRLFGAGAEVRVRSFRALARERERVGRRNGVRWGKRSEITDGWMDGWMDGWLDRWIGRAKVRKGGGEARLIHKEGEGGSDRYTRAHTQAHPHTHTRTHAGTQSHTPRFDYFKANVAVRAHGTEDQEELAVAQCGGMSCLRCLVPHPPALEGQAARYDLDGKDLAVRKDSAHRTKINLVQGSAPTVRAC